MSGTIYLTAEQIIFMNGFILERTSSKEELDIKEAAALKACVLSPKQTKSGNEVYSSIDTKAAVLFINLIRNHCFASGNKRTALMALRYFLQENRYMFLLGKEESIELCKKIDSWNAIELDSLIDNVSATIKDFKYPIRT